jgi:hypothetical protein
MHKTSRLTFAVLMALILAAATFAFANANTVPSSGAGDGEGIISGYTVSGIRYILNAANPGTIDEVRFILTPDAGAGAPNTVMIQLGGNWYTCTGGAPWSCSVGGAVTVLDALTLRVVAAE